MRTNVYCGNQVWPFLSPGLRVGLVLNFGRTTLKEGIDRVILDCEGGRPGIELARGQT